MTERSAYDPFAPKSNGGERRPRRSTAATELPSWLLDALRERDVPDAALEPLQAQFERLTPAEKASALADLQTHRQATADIDELATALIAFHNGDTTALGDVDDAELAAVVLADVRVAAGDDREHDDVEADAVQLVEQLVAFAEAFDLDVDAVIDDVKLALDGSDDALTGYGVQLVAGEPLDRWADLVRQLDALLGTDGPDLEALGADLAAVAASDGDVAAWLDEHPEIEATVGDDGTVTGLTLRSAQSDVGDETGESTSDGQQPASDAHSSSDEPVGDVLDLSATADDVPKTANDVIAWIGDAENEDALRARAQLALDAELAYPGGMRKTVRQALDLALGEADVQRAIDERG